MTSKEVNHRGNLSLQLQRSLPHPHQGPGLPRRAQAVGPSAPGRRAAGLRGCWVPGPPRPSSPSQEQKFAEVREERAQGCSKFQPAPNPVNSAASGQRAKEGVILSDPDLLTSVHAMVLDQHPSGPASCSNPASPRLVPARPPVAVPVPAGTVLIWAHTAPRGASRRLC